MDLNLPGISAANEKHIRQIAPELCTQLQTLHQRGWQVEERPNNRGSHIAGRRIVIDPRASFTETNTEKRGPHSYLRVLAHQVGCGLDLHRSPISLATRDEYVQGSLRREAAGVWNELQLRDSILERTGGRIDIWSGAEDEYKALASIRERVVNAAEAKQKIAARLGEMRAANGKTYSSIYARQYDLFQISDKTSEDAIKYVQACFNETGVALPSNQIKASCRRPDGAYYWMTQEGLTATLNDFKLSFQDKGFADDEIAGAVMTALSSGTKWQGTAGDDWKYFTYHDEKKNRVCGIFVKLGERPGEIVQAKMRDPGLLETHSIHSPDGRYNYLRLKNADALRPVQAAFASHGIPVSEIPVAVMTAMAAGRRVPDSESDDGWQVYQFRYKNAPDELTLRVKQDASGDIKDFELMEKSVPSTAVPKRTNAIDAILAGSEGEALRDFATQLNVSAKELLTTVIAEDNKKRFSFECPGFGVYRANVKGRSVTLLARTENGQVAEVRPASALDGLFSCFPQQEERYAQLQKDGWNIRAGVPGEGTFCSGHTKEVVIDPAMAGDAFRSMRALAHEMAHAIYKLGDIETEEEHVSEYALNEGNSMFAEYKLIDEATDDYSRSEIRKIVEGDNGGEATAIYAEWRQEHAAASNLQEKDKADHAARIAFGAIYRKLTGSASPDGSNYEMRWRAHYRSWFGENARLTLMDRLQSQNSSVKIWDMSGKWTAPSFDNVQVIHRLPAQPGLDKPKTIFIDKNTFVRQVKGQDPMRIELVIKNALDFGSITVKESEKGTNLQTATCSYKKQGMPHTVRLDFDDTGRVFGLDVVLPSISTEKVQPQVTSEDDGMKEHRDFIKWMNATLS